MFKDGYDSNKNGVLSSPITFSHCPASQILEATCAEGAAAIWTPPLVHFQNAVTVDCSHTSGDIFPIGQTIVTYTARDKKGNVGYCSFEIAVQDTLPPEITINCKQSSIHEAGKAFEAASASAVDRVDGTVYVFNDAKTTVNSDVPGTYKVTYSAIDSADNFSIKECVVRVYLACSEKECAYSLFVEGQGFEIVAKDRLGTDKYEFTPKGRIDFPITKDIYFTSFEEAFLIFEHKNFQTAKLLVFKCENKQLVSISDVETVRNKFIKSL